MGRKALLALLFFAVCAAVASVAQRASQGAPKVSLSTNRIATPGHIEVRGAGFTPKHNVSSHLRKPEGGEFPVLPLLTDERGEFVHVIDTLVLTHGRHELWVIDDNTKTSSNRVQFEVTAN